jgi:hypothetical protein
MNQNPSPPVLVTLGPKRKRKPQVNGLGFLHQLLRKSRLGKGMKMGLNRGPNSRKFNKRNEQI